MVYVDPYWYGCPTENSPRNFSLAFNRKDPNGEVDFPTQGKCYNNQKSQLAINTFIKFKEKKLMEWVHNQLKENRLS